ncbi:hypothetical protein [uncultured Ruthenibacterium sp.]|uniref:hypothetical protein n=1 Tax=uncultured Ruthenibacterium sp. TaxID=1905347 RepID=UPI00349ECC82
MTNHERIQQALDRRLNALHVSENTSSLVFLSPRRKTHPFRKVVALAVAAAFTFVFSVSVLAASFPPLQRLFEKAGIQLSSLMQPVELSCVSEGIEMQVLAAVNDDERVTVYLALRDQEGSRINEKTVLSNLQIAGTLGPCDVAMVDFDPSTGIAIYRLSGYGIDELDGKPITVEVKTLLNEMENVHRQNTGYPLGELSNLEYALQEGININGSSVVYTSDGRSPFGDVTPPVLEKSELPEGWNPNLPWGTITAVGFVENSVHVQVKISELGRYARADLYLLDSNGQELNTGSGTLEFGQQYSELNADYSEYIEYILPVPAGQSLDDFSLYFDALSYGSAVRGNWHVTFTLDSVYKQASFPCDITFDSVHYTEVTLSPLGISIHGEGLQANGETPTVQAYDENGQEIEFYVSSTIFSFEDDGTSTLTVQHDFRIPVLPENVSKLLINGEEISLS